jgi:hypothetical protein
MAKLPVSDLVAKKTALTITHVLIGQIRFRSFGENILH